MLREHEIRKLQLSKSGCSCFKTEYHIDCAAYPHPEVFYSTKS